MFTWANNIQLTSDYAESKKSILECASYDLIKNRQVNKHALENSNYSLIKKRK